MKQIIFLLIVLFLANLETSAEVLENLDESITNADVVDNTTVTAVTSVDPIALSSKFSTTSKASWQV